MSMDQQQDITDVIEPSAAFTYDGMGFAVPVFVSNNRCIALYDVTDDANSLLNYRRDVSIPCILYTSPSPRDKRQSRMPSSA